jgi:hypothetical protein
MTNETTPSTAPTYSEAEILAMDLDTLDGVLFDAGGDPPGMFPGHSRGIQMALDETKPLEGGRSIAVAEVVALQNRALLGLLVAAQLGRPGAFLFWRGSINALRALTKPEGCTWFAQLDEKTLGYDPPTYLKAAWASLPDRTESRTMAEVQEILLAAGVELTPQPVHDERC